MRLKRLTFEDLLGANEVRRINQPNSSELEEKLPRYEPLAAARGWRGHD
jgi:hypothetical protein